MLIAGIKLKDGVSATANASEGNRIITAGVAGSVLPPM
jgi:hypothetical protein